MKSLFLSFVLGLALSCHVCAQSIKPVTQVNDVNLIGDEFFDKGISWVAGDSLRFDVFAREGNVPLDFSGICFPVLFVAAQTNHQQVYIARTGTVVSATNGHVRVFVPWSNAVLSTSRDYAAWMTVLRVTESAVTQEVATVAYCAVTAIPSPFGTVYTNLPPLTPPFQFTFGDFGDPATWWQFPAGDVVDIPGIEGLTTINGDGGLVINSGAGPIEINGDVVFDTAPVIPGYPTDDDLVDAVNDESSVREESDRALSNLVAAVSNLFRDADFSLSNLYAAVDAKLTSSSNTLYALVTNRAAASMFDNLPAAFLPRGSGSYSGGADSKAINAMPSRVDFFSTNKTYATMGVFHIVGNNNSMNIPAGGLEAWMYDVTNLLTIVAGSRSAYIGAGIHTGNAAVRSFMMYGEAQGGDNYNQDMVIVTPDYITQNYVERIRIDSSDSEVEINGNLVAGAVIASSFQGDGTGITGVLPNEAMSNRFISTSSSNAMAWTDTDESFLNLSARSGLAVRTNLMYSSIGPDGSHAIFMNRTPPAGTPFTHDLYLNTGLSINGNDTIVGRNFISMKESGGLAVFKMEKNEDEIEFSLRNASDGLPRNSAVFIFQNEIRVKDTGGSTYMSITPDEVKIGANSWTMYGSGDVEQDATNTATLGIVSAVSMTVGGSSVATGTPLYVEADPAWTVASTGMLTKVDAAGTYATGMPVYVESDPAFATALTGLMTKAEANSKFSTGTPVYVESDPVWDAEKGGYATGTPVYVESDPVFTAASTGLLTKVDADSKYATGTPVQVESDPIWNAEKSGYATGTPVYAESDPVFAAASTGLLTKAEAGSMYSTGTPVYAESDPVYAAASTGLLTKAEAAALYATGTPVQAESDPIYAAASTGLLTKVQAASMYATGTPIYVETGTGTLTEASISGFVLTSDMEATNHIQDAAIDSKANASDLAALIIEFEGGSNRLDAAITAEALTRDLSDAAISNRMDAMGDDYSNKFSSVDATLLDGMDSSDFTSLLAHQMWQTNVGRRVFTYPTNGQVSGTFNGYAMTNVAGTNFVAYYFENARGLGTGGWIEVQAVLK